MKLGKAVMLSMGILFLVSCETETPEKGVKYNDDLLNMIDRLDDKVESMNDTFDDYVAEEMNEGLSDLKKQVETTKKEVEDHGDFFGDAALQNAAMGYVDAVAKSVPQYEERVKIESVDDADYTDDMADKSYDLMDEIQERIDNANKNLIEVQQKFSTDHNFLLVDKEK